tara:strand:- start:156 stop:818 length:663 start_codon:yes stop_codon:yes gene_type:complete
MSTMTIELLNQRVQVLEKQLLALMGDKTADKKDKKVKKEKDASPKPKRTSAWILFQAANREDVKERLTKETGDEKVKSTDVMTELAKLWKALSAEEKSPYEEKAKQIRAERSDSDTEAVDVGDGELKKEAPAPEKPSKKEKKEKDDKPKKKRVSGYILFQKAMRDEAKQSLEAAAEEDEPKIKQSAIMSELGKMWKALSDEEREEWNEKAAEQKASDSEE